MARSFLRLRGALPVIHHLGRQDHVQSETCDKTVENKLVVDLLQSGEDARQRASEIVKHLTCQLPVNQPVNGNLPQMRSAVPFLPRARL